MIHRPTEDRALANVERDVSAYRKLSRYPIMSKVFQYDRLAAMLGIDQWAERIRFIQTATGLSYEVVDYWLEWWEDWAQSPTEWEPPSLSLGEMEQALRQWLDQAKQEVKMIS